VALLGKSETRLLTSQAFCRLSARTALTPETAIEMIAASASFQLSISSSKSGCHRHVLDAASSASLRPGPATWAAYYVDRARPPLLTGFPIHRIRTPTRPCLYRNVRNRASLQDRRSRASNEECTPTDSSCGYNGLRRRSIAGVRRGFGQSQGGRGVGDRQAPGRWDSQPDLALLFSLFCPGACAPLTKTNHSPLYSTRYL
jgi:hypothetical protein